MRREVPQPKLEIGVKNPCRTRKSSKGGRSSLPGKVERSSPPLGDIVAGVKLAKGKKKFWRGCRYVGDTERLKMPGNVVIATSMHLQFSKLSLRF